ncbi:hypothetical protein DDF62_18985 [Caulobacter radicis]|nr:hypothetical protein DDF62_18985 [Caulobacter radicis]
MFDDYFDGGEVRPEFSKAYVSLWSGWLGKDNLHLLDGVGEEEWSRFNALIAAISTDFRVGIARRDPGVVEFPAKIQSVLSRYEEAMEKDESQFSTFVIPQLHCLITEAWDYTYVIWHRNDGAMDALKPYIADARLHHFSD